MRSDAVLFSLFVLGGVAHAGPNAVADAGMAIHASNASVLKGSLRKIGAPRSVVASVDRHLAVAEQRLSFHNTDKPNINLSQGWLDGRGDETILEVHPSIYSRPPLAIESTTNRLASEIAKTRPYKISVNERKGMISDSRTSPTGIGMYRSLQLVKTDIHSASGRLIKKGSWVVHKQNGADATRYYLIEPGARRVTRASAGEFNEAVQSGRP